MGLLDAFKQYINDALPGGLLNPEAAQLPGLLNNQANATANAIKAKGQAFKRGLDDPQKYAGDAFAAGMDMAGMAPLGLTVWHGSPHKFSKFDMSKIGTGEGAQAYGHGLYMAESPAVAREYQLALGNKPSAVDDFAGFEAQAAIAKNNGNAKKAIQWLESRKKITDDAKGFLMPGAYEKQIADYDEAIRRISSGEVSKNAGSMYKVDIPDEAVARFLDWDKPLSQQAPEVQALAKEYGLPVSEPGRSLYSVATEQAAYKNGASPASHPDVFKAAYPQAANILRERGLPGIRYLDGGSRSAGQGSSNFVLFDDQLPRILETNGVPTGLLPWQPGEWKGLLK